MTRSAVICNYISSLAISLLLALPLSAQSAKVLDTDLEPDTTPWLNGFAIGVDLAGLVQNAVSDYGQMEAQLRINLRDRYFPVLEAGLGMASHDDEITQITYSSKSPYFRIGGDYNLMKDKHDAYRIYGGVRYGFSIFKYDFSHPDIKDPCWGGEAEWAADDVNCSCHWAEFSGGVDAKIWGPIHLGWSVRYRKRIAHDFGEHGKVWYVPGFGKSGSTRIGYTFMISLDI